MSRSDRAMDRRGNRGFTYIGLLIFIVLIGIVLAVAGQVWNTNATREKEKELLFVGNQFRNAIAAYYANNTGTGDRYPKSFDDLLRDSHQPTVRRYLRKVYVDPLTGTTEWGLIKTPNGGIMGVYSLASGHPLKQAESAFPSAYAGFSGATAYSGWQFAFFASDGAGPAPPAEAAQSSAPVAAQSQPPPPQAAVVAPPKPQDPSDRRCPYIASFDARVCAAEKAKWGSADDCFSSAQIRQAACQAGAPLPALNVRYI